VSLLRRHWVHSSRFSLQLSTSVLLDRRHCPAWIRPLNLGLPKPSQPVGVLTMLRTLVDVFPWRIVFGMAIAAVVMLISAAMKRKK
jgi:hypothetical protein